MEKKFSEYPHPTAMNNKKRQLDVTEIAPNKRCRIEHNHRSFRICRDLLVDVAIDKFGQKRFDRINWLLATSKTARVRWPFINFAREHPSPDVVFLEDATTEELEMVKCIRLFYCVCK